MLIPFILYIPRLGQDLMQNLSTIYRVVKKLEHFQRANFRSLHMPETQTVNNFDFENEILF